MSDTTPPSSENIPSNAVELAQYPRPRIVRTQGLVSLTVLLVIVVTGAAVGLGAHNEKLGHWLQERETSSCQRDDRLIPYTLGFVDAGDRLLLGDLPQLDTSKGGVYVLGSSTAIYCLEDWNLPPDQARLIHNFGIYSVNPTQILQFARYLIDRQSLLTAGGEKSLVFIGLAVTDMVEDNQDVTVGGARYLPACLKRSGLYDYDPIAGISVVPLSPPARLITYEKARSRSFLLRCLSGAEGAHARRSIDRAQFRKEITTRLGSDWEPVMSRQLPQLGALLDYLQSRHVRVVPFLVPTGSWTQGLTARDQFVSGVRALCEVKSLEFLDFSHLLKDDDFSDPLHPAADGTRKVHDVLMKIAMSHLHRTGAY